MLIKASLLSGNLGHSVEAWLILTENHWSGHLTSSEDKRTRLLVHEALLSAQTWRALREPFPDPSSQGGQSEGHTVLSAHFGAGPQHENPD